MVSLNHRWLNMFEGVNPHNFEHGLTYIYCITFSLATTTKTIIYQYYKVINREIYQVIWPL